MAEAPSYLTGEQARAHWMRVDTAQILKRFYFLERSLLLSMGAWLPAIGPIPIKTGLPRAIWQNALTADALRERVFELRYPNRLMTIEGDAALVRLADAARNAPSAAAFLLGVSQVFLPALKGAYGRYLTLSDPLADGPTERFLRVALHEKVEQQDALLAWAAELGIDEGARAWADSLDARLSALGGIPVEGTADSGETELPDAVPYELPDHPARDPRFFACRFYWPDIVDPSYPYGEGAALQLRSAVSHLNEAWAVETAGAILAAFAGELPWEWIRDAARWCYDEARHCRMGYDRLLVWGFLPEEIPLGTYIYDSAAGQDPIYRLGMLFFFETKNIGKKTARARKFHEYGDAVSEHDMDFDWADETIHASYGKHWLGRLLEVRGGDPRDVEVVRSRCAELVAAEVATATPEEIAVIRRVADRLVAQAERH